MQKTIAGINFFTIQEKRILKERILAYITFTNEFTIKLMYFGLDKEGKGEFYFQIKGNPLLNSIKVSEKDLFLLQKTYTFQFTMLCDNEAIISPAF